MTKQFDAKKWGRRFLFGVAALGVSALTYGGFRAYQWYTAPVSVEDTRAALPNAFTPQPTYVPLTPPPTPQPTLEVSATPVFVSPEPTATLTPLSTSEPAYTGKRFEITLAGMDLTQKEITGTLDDHVTIAVPNPLTAGGILVDKLSIETQGNAYLKTPTQFHAFDAQGNPLTGAFDKPVSLEINVGLCPYPYDFKIGTDRVTGDCAYGIVTYLLPHFTEGHFIPAPIPAPVAKASPSQPLVATPSPQKAAQANPPLGLSQPPAPKPSVAPKPGQGLAGFVLDITNVDLSTQELYGRVVPAATAYWKLENPNKLSSKPVEVTPLRQAKTVDELVALLGKNEGPQPALATPCPATPSHAAQNALLETSFAVEDFDYKNPASFLAVVGHGLAAQQGIKPNRMGPKDQIDTEYLHDGNHDFEDWQKAVEAGKKAYKPKPTKAAEAQPGNLDPLENENLNQLAYFTLVHGDLAYFEQLEKYPLGIDSTPVQGLDFLAQLDAE